MDGGSITTAARAWLGHLAIERVLAQATIEAYARDLARLLEQSGIAEITELTASIVRDHLERMHAEGLSAGSRMRALRTISSFGSWLVREGHVAANPCVEIDAPRLQRRLPPVLSIEDVGRLIEAPDVATRLGLRDRAMLEVLYSTGMRVSELAGLLVLDLRLSDGCALARGKGGKERLVMLGEPAIAWLLRYLGEVRPEWEGRRDDRGAVFLSQQGRPMTRQAIWYRIRACAHAAGLEERISAHLIRHSFATHMLEGGADLRLVQELLGHSQADSTAIYTRVAKGRVAEIVELRHPRGGRRH